ncbi:MAG: DUF1634 domain-containing protein [Candidatus Acidiferrales bacterium]
MGIASSAGAGGGTQGNIQDKKVETFLGKLLRAGVFLAAIVVLTGGVWHVLQSRDALPNYKIFHGEPTELRHVPKIVHDAISMQPLGLIQLGLLLLIATPVARVFFSVVGFVIERDWMYVVATLLVLALLIYSLSSNTLASQH